MFKTVLRTALAGAVFALAVSPAPAGNIALTGHDDELHYFFGDPNAGIQLGQLVAFARAGSATPSLPVLAFDGNASGNGFELNGALTSLGIAHVTFDLNAGGVTAGLFNPALYSAIVVASARNVGGGDIAPGAYSNLAAQSAAIASFFNAGGGILGLAADGDPTGYSYLPNSASVNGTSASTGFYTTVAGAAHISAVNGDQTHNYFDEPGTGGVDPAYVVWERNHNALNGATDRAFTIAIEGGSIGPGGGFSTSPEPATVTMLGMGVASMFGYGWRRRKTA